MPRRSLLPRPPLLALLVGLLLAAPAAVAQSEPEAFALEARIEASDPQFGAFFGRTLSVSVCPDGSTLALTTSYAEDASTSPEAVGTAYVLRRSPEGGAAGGTWAEEARLPDPSAGAYSGFGSSAAVLCRADGSALALVGDREHTPAALPPNSGGGAVYAYRRAAAAGGGAWALEDTLVGPAPEPFVSFGFALGLVGLADGSALALVSAPGREYPTTFGGRVYAYAHGAAGTPADSAWALEGALSGPFRFGLKVALAADSTVPGGAVALVREPETAPDAWRVGVYERAGTGAWARTAELLDPSGQERSDFGQSLAVDGGTEADSPARALVGAPGVNGDVALIGAAYVFEPGGGAWGLADSLRAPDPTLSAALGSAVALLGPVALVGAKGTDTAAGDNAGAAYHFRLDPDAAGSGGGSGGWSLVERLEAPNGGYLDAYGSATALAPLPEGVLGLVAAFGETTPFGLSTGAVYAYTAEGRPVAAAPGAPAVGAAPLRLTAFPNPARAEASGAVTLRLSLPEAQGVTVTVFDGLGRRVRTLRPGPLATGEHAVRLDLAGLAPGVYLARAAAGAEAATARLTLLR